MHTHKTQAMKSRKQALVPLLALGAALAMPAAFAQDSATAEAMQQDTESMSEQATAANAATSQQPTWAELDANADGQLSKTEAAASASLAAVFGDADADADGQLTAEEYRAYHEATAEPEEAADAAVEPAAETL